MTQFSTCIARAYTEFSTSPLFFMGEDICHRTGPIISPAWLRANALPQWRRILEPLRGKGFKFIFHSDGRYGPALPVILEELDADGSAPDRAQRLQRHLRDSPQKYPHKFLFGNVCCSVTLPQGNDFDVEDETLELIERMGPDQRIHRLIERGPQSRAACQCRDDVSQRSRIRRVPHRRSIASASGVRQSPADAD